ncbi:hypothetical protein [Parasphingorhabdus sp.]|uniref:hypothetical protein n=1 Tax=Parasphingorhabdus sp. TaxID=2709688 RepID=UPI0030952E9A
MQQPISYTDYLPHQTAALSCFDGGTGRQVDPPKSLQMEARSREAAFAVAQDIAGRRRQVWETFEPYGTAGSTCDVIAEGLSLPVHILRPRASEPEKFGKLFALPEKRTRQTGHNVTDYSAIKPAKMDKTA